MAISKSGQRAKSRHAARTAIRNAKKAGDYDKARAIKKASTKESRRITKDRSRKSDDQRRKEVSDFSRRLSSSLQSKKIPSQGAQEFQRRMAVGAVPSGPSFNRLGQPQSSFLGSLRNYYQGQQDRMQQERAKPISQRISEGAQRAFLGPIAGTQTGRELAYGIPKAAVRGALSIGLESPLGRPFETAGRREINPQEFGIERLLGKEPIKGVGTRALEYEETLTGKGYKHPTMLAVAGATGATALDLWISGGGKQAISEIAKSKSPKIIKSLLKGKIADNLLDDAARQLVDVDNADDVARTIKQLQSPLHAEARKDVLYRGTGKQGPRVSAEKNFGEGTYLTNKKEYAAQYGDVKEYTLSKKAKVLNLDRVRNSEGIDSLYDKKTGMMVEDVFGVEPNKISNYAKSKGYDAVYVSGENGTHETIVLNDKVLSKLSGGIKTTTPKSGIPKDAGEKIESFMKAKSTESGLGRTESLSRQQVGATPKQTAKVLKESQKDISYLERIAKAKKSQVNPFINTKNLDISDEGKKFIDDTVKDVKPEIEEAVGKKLTNREAVEFADKTSQTLNRVIGREQTKQFEAALLNTRRRLATMAESGTVDKEYIETLKTVKTFGTDIARKLQSFSMEAGATNVTKQKILEAVLKVNDNTDEILKVAKGVDFDNANEAVNFYRKFIKPTTSEWLDMIRYNSMLSSPTTHIINAFSNAVNSAIVAPIEKGLTGGIDFLGGIAGKKRGAFAQEALSYWKGYGKSIGDAAHNFAGVMTGKRGMTNLDLKFMPVASKGAKGVATKALSFPMRLLEASDQFFSTLAEGGEKAALTLRESKGIKVPLLAMKAKEKAAYRLFRQELGNKGQGHILDAVDQFTSKLMGLRNNPNPIVSTIAKYTVPFVKTPMNIFKQGVEYSPAGFSTIVGAKNKTEQLSKAIIGSTVFAGAATMLASGRLTWGEPTSEKQRQEWRQAGIQPYSVKIGDKWYSYQKLAPGIAFPMALVAVIDDVQKKRKLDDTTTELVLSSVAKYGEFLADQSYVKSIGDLLSAARGGEAGIARAFSNYPQQLVPLRAFGGWLARLTDPEQRKIDNKAGFIDKQIQLLMSNIPGLSQKVPARLDVEGNPIPNRDRGINAVSPARVSTQDDRLMQYHLDAEKKRQSQREHQQLLDKAKEEVLESGKTQTIGDTTVFMEGGEVKTTQSKTLLESKQKYEEFKNLSDKDFMLKREELSKIGDKEIEIAKQIGELRRNETTKQMGLEFEGEWSRNDFPVQDKANVVMKKMQTLSDEDKSNFFQELETRDVMTDDLKKEVGKQVYSSLDNSSFEAKYEDFQKYTGALRGQLVKEMFSEVNSVYQGGDEERATEMVNQMSDEDYKVYKDARQSWRGGNTKQLREYLGLEPTKAVQFLRSLGEPEQERILDVMTDEEYKLYESGKEKADEISLGEQKQIEAEITAIEQSGKSEEEQGAMFQELKKKYPTMGTGMMDLKERSGQSHIAIPPTTLAGKNNNPGNLRFVGQPGATQGQGGFAAFDTPEAGYEALQKQIELDASRGMSVRQFITKYAPPTENDTETYIKQFVSKLGKDADTPLANYETELVAKWMAFKESGTKFGDEDINYALTPQDKALVEAVGNEEITPQQASVQVATYFAEKVKNQVPVVEDSPAITQIPTTFTEEQEMSRTEAWLMGMQNPEAAIGVYRLFQTIGTFGSIIQNTPEFQESQKPLVNNSPFLTALSNSMGRYYGSQPS